MYVCAFYSGQAGQAGKLAKKDFDKTIDILNEQTAHFYSSSSNLFMYMYAFFYDQAGQARKLAKNILIKPQTSKMKRLLYL